MRSCSQQPYVPTTRKAFACRVDRAVIRMKDSVFVWPSVNSRLIIPCRIIRTRLRGLNAASFPFMYCHGSTRTVFPTPIHIYSLVCRFVAGWSCFFFLIFLFLLGYFYFIFSFFYFHVQLLHGMVRQRWLHAWYSCSHVLFANYNSTTISEIRPTREASIAWLSILLHVFSFLSIRCCGILSNFLLPTLPLLLLLLLLLFLLLLERQYYWHHLLYHRLFVFF